MKKLTLPKGVLRGYEPEYEDEILIVEGSEVKKQGTSPSTGPVIQMPREPVAGR